ncbi:MAG: hypothetical protein ISR51_09395 [Rhodospirillales bacterium]|nr:hypothetical protein [Alphaproteobacteria bacterium]MBL6948876.1 hypothetical protein [Rhodospirillales bacterium]
MMDIAVRKGTSVAEEMAFQLVQAAVQIDGARHDKSFAPEALVMALNQNMETWVAMRSILKRQDCGLDEDVRENLNRLGLFVSERTFSTGETGENGRMAGEIADGTIDTLININLQISEGLLEGDQENL